MLEDKGEIIHLLYPKDNKEYFEALEQWFSIAKRPNIALLYDLAVSAFILQYYQTSSKAFKLLERKSIGHPDRFRFSRVYLDEKGEKKVFDGTVVRINSPYEGEIRVDSLHNLDKNIRFRTEPLISVPKENDFVRFAIGFNFVSPEAIDVAKQTSA